MTSYLDSRFYSEFVTLPNKGAIIKCFDANGTCINQFTVKPGFRLPEWLIATTKTFTVTNHLGTGHPGHAKMPVLKDKDTDYCWFVFSNYISNENKGTLLFYYVKEQIH